MISTLNEAGVILFLALAVVVNPYVFFYAFRPWRSTPQGRALMLKAAGSAFVIDVVATWWLFGDHWLRDLLRFVGLVLYFVGTTYLFLSLLLSPGAEKYPPWSWLRKLRRKPKRADS